MNGFAAKSSWDLLSTSPSTSTGHPIARHSHSAAVYRRRVWVYGGLFNLHALDDLWTWHIGNKIELVFSSNRYKDCVIFWLSISWYLLITFLTPPFITNIKIRTSNWLLLLRFSFLWDRDAISNSLGLNVLVVIGHMLLAPRPVTRAEPAANATVNVQSCNWINTWYHFFALTVFNGLKQTFCHQNTDLVPVQLTGNLS